MSRFLMSIALLLALAGCNDAPDQDVPLAVAEPAAATQEGHAHDDAEHAHPDQEAMPLLPIMMRMAAEMGGFMHAMWLEDFEAMGRHANGVSAHAAISTDELERIESVLGDEIEAFEAADAEVHEASIRLRESAEERDMDAVLEHLATVQSGCVACHDRFRERLRTNAKN